MYARFAKWQDDGTLEAIFRALSAGADMENLSLDSTCIKVHESANGGEKTTDKAVGRTIGGLNTKLHAWFRRIATRYDKLDESFLAFVYIAAIAILLI